MADTGLELDNERLWKILNEKISEVGILCQKKKDIK
jgi:hypothetical protein